MKLSANFPYRSGIAPESYRSDDATHHITVKLEDGDMGHYGSHNNPIPMSFSHDVDTKKWYELSVDLHIGGLTLCIPFDYWDDFRDKLIATMEAITIVPNYKQIAKSVYDETYGQSIL